MSFQFNLSSKTYSGLFVVSAYRSLQTVVYYMINVAYFNCFSGVSGNMILGALLDAGLSMEALQEELSKLPVTGFSIKCSPVKRQGIAATYVEVDTEETHIHRHLHHIIEILEKSSLDQRINYRSTCRRVVIFSRKNRFF